MTQPPRDELARELALWAARIMGKDAVATDCYVKTLGRLSQSMDDPAICFTVTRNLMDEGITIGVDVVQAALESARQVKRV